MAKKDPKKDYQRLCADRRLLQQWYAAGLGQWLLEIERRQLDEILPNLFGYHLIQVGHPVGEDLLGSSRIGHRVVVDTDRAGGPGASPAADSPQVSGSDVSGSDVSGGACGGNGAPADVGLRGRPDALPLQRDAVDVVVLPHTLEFEARPHEVLREVERVLVAEGHVVILGFNPWSPWGLWRILRRRRGRPPWYGTFRSVLRLKDWLALLGFDTVMCRMYFFRPPLRHAGIMRRLAFLERWGERWWPFLGGAYVLVARKRVISLTPVKPRWRPRRLVHVNLARRLTHRRQSGS